MDKGEEFKEIGTKSAFRIPKLNKRKIEIVQINLEISAIKCVSLPWKDHP
jgi:hypothetical protein